MVVARALALTLVVAAGCTKRSPDYCEADEECADPAKPFCDIKGEYAESDHTKNRCSVTPAGCPIERCGCTVGAPIACANEELQICAPDAHSLAGSPCALGCAPGGEARCATFEPSNGLGEALALAEAEPDVVLPPGARIDTEIGLVQDSAGAPIA